MLVSPMETFDGFTESATEPRWLNINYHKSKYAVETSSYSKWLDTTSSG